MLSGRGLYEGLITPPKESYLLCCVSECGLQNLSSEEAKCIEVVKPQKKKNMFCKVKIDVVCNKDLVEKSSVHFCLKISFFGRASDLYLCLYNQLFALFHCVFKFLTP